MMMGTELILLVLLVVGVVLFLRWNAGGGIAPGGTRENPLTILQRRYATGEIDEETYHRMRRELVGPAVGEHEGTNGIRRAS
jgi:uncharacterized membrane protein